MKKMFGYILAGLLILPLIFVLPSCKKAEDDTAIGGTTQPANDATTDEGAGEDPLGDE